MSLIALVVKHVELPIKQHICGNTEIYGKQPQERMPVGLLYTGTHVVSCHQSLQ